MIKATLILLLFVATLARSQNCASTCRVVCDEDDNILSPLPARGPKGQKGERGRTGASGYPGMPAPTKLIHNIEERVQRLENYVNKLPMKYRRNLKIYSCFKLISAKVKLIFIKILRICW